MNSFPEQSISDFLLFINPHFTSGSLLGVSTFPSGSQKHTVSHR